MSINAMALGGWIEIYKDTPSSFTQAMNIFQEGLEKNPGMLEILVGKCVASEKIKKFTLTVDTINSIIVEQPDFDPAYEMKARILMMINDWDQCLEVCQEIIHKDSQNLNANLITLFNQTARVGGLEECQDQIKSFIQTLQEVEPQNPELYLFVSKLISRICSEDTMIIQMTQSLLFKCKKMDTLNALYPLELANQMMMLRDYNQAFEFYSEASSLDDTKIEALGGMINCKLIDGHIEDAIHQIQFMNEISHDGKTSLISYLEAQIFQKQNNSQEALKYLDESLRLHITLTKNQNPDLKFYILLDPYKLLQVAELYLDLPEQSAQQKGIKLLETITGKIPGYVNAHLMLAKQRMNQPQNALKSVLKVLEIDPKCQDARIFQAMIGLKENNWAQAESALDQAISQNFRIRENPVFMLLKGEVEIKGDRCKQGLESLEQLFQVKGVKIGQDLPRVDGMFKFTEELRCKTYVNLAQAYAKNKRDSEAKKLIDEAVSEWAGTEHEVTILMSNAQIMVEMGDIKKALDILKTVDSSQPNFVETKKLMAQIYLDHLKDRRNFAKCYLDMIEAEPSFENYKLMGKALINIQEPEDAIYYLKKAQVLSGNDEDIVRDIGNCLIQTHDYHKVNFLKQALKYYETSLMQYPKRIDLILDLGRLYTQIGNFDKAEQLLQPQFFKEDFQQQPIDVLKRNVQGFIAIYELYLAKFQEGDETIRKSLEKALKIQGDLVERCKQEGYPVEPERKYTSELYLKLANYLVKYERADTRALSYLERALKYNANDEQIYQLMISIYFKTEDFDECLNKCRQLNKINSRNEFASKMISELMIIQKQGDQALQKFEELFDKNPSNVAILSQMILIYIRNGQIQKAQDCLQRSENQSQNANEPGICFCKGLILKNTGNPQKAIQEFNKAKREQAYSDESLRYMLEIFVNPHQDLYFSFSDEMNSIKNLNIENIRGAENALLDSKSKITDNTRFMAQFAFLLSYGRTECHMITGISSRKKVKPQEIIEQTSQILTKVLEEKPGYHPALLYLAATKFMQKKHKDCLAILQSIVNSNYQSDQGDAYEMAALIYADYLMSDKQYTDAEQLLKNTFMFNKNNCKIMELLGILKDKQQELAIATQCYQKAWDISKQSIPSIGFRLASNLLKQRKIPKCIEVCNKIIKDYPEYPKIEKEILQKAIGLIKTSVNN